MTDDRGALAQDRTSFYPADTTAIPTMRGPEDMPDSTAGAAFGAGWRTAQDDWPGRSGDVLNSAYGPVIDAVRRETGKPISTYVWIGHGRGGVNEDVIWRDIAAIRAQRPDFLKDAGADQDAFTKQVTDRTIARRARDLGMLERARGLGPGAAALGGQFAGAMADPINLMTLPLGGTAETFAGKVLIAGLSGAGVEAIEQPMIAGERAQRGETLGVKEALTNVAVAGVGGAAVQGLIVEPLSLLARKHIGWDQMTPDERAAVNVLERQAEVQATSPYAPGLGGEVHAERLDDVMARIMADEPATGPTAKSQLMAGTSPIARETASVPGNVSRGTPAFQPMPRAQFKSMVRGAESSGNDLAAAGTSSAFGRYQFTRDTWLRYYKRRFGQGVLSDAAILAKRADGAVQEQLMDDLTADNAAALARVGAPETPGNLYLMHFAGQGGGSKVLRAADDVPVRDLLKADAIEANPFLRDMTAGDLRRWADRKMGGKGEAGPVVRRDQFADDVKGDAAWREAQRDSDAAYAELDAVRRDRTGEVADAPDFALGRDIGGADVPARMDGGVPRETAVEPAAVGMDWEPAEVPITAPPASATSFTTAKGSTYRIEPDGTTTRDKAFRPEHGEAEQGPQPTSQRTFYVTPGEANALGIIQSRGGHPMEVVLDDATGAAGLRYVAGPDVGKIIKGTVVPARRVPELGMLPVEIWSDGRRVHFGNPITDIRRDGSVGAARDISRENGGSIVGQAAVDPDAAARTGDDLRAAAGSADQQAAVARFDDPAGPAADVQVQSIEHDLRLIADDPAQAGFTVQLGEEGDARSVADVLAEWDADAAAIDAIRGCL